MYRTPSSPLFDLPEYPTLRRIKPLPKRRRTALNIDPDINVNPNPNSSGINLGPLSCSNSHSACISSAYHTHSPQLPSKEVPRTPDILPSLVDVQRSQYDWRLPPELFLPEDILRASPVLSDQFHAPRIDDGIGGDGEDDTGAPFPPSERKTPPPPMGPGQLSLTATPPPPSDTSTDDEESRQLTRTSYHSQFLGYTREDLDREELNMEEELGPEVTEGEIQDRLFLRAETERLLAQADSLSAKMALRNYYHSMGYRIPEFGPGAGTSIPPASSGIEHLVANYPNTMPLTGGGLIDGLVSPELSAGVAPENNYVAVGVGRENGEGDGRGDYTDHLGQQCQGNTKKRKVPANLGSSPPHHHYHHSHYYPSHRSVVGAYGSSGLGYDPIMEAQEGEKGFSFGLGFGLGLGGQATAEDTGSGASMDGVGSDVFGPLPGPNGMYQPQMDPMRQFPLRQFYRKAKLSPAALAGMQRKALIKGRKKQLEAIMGTLSIRDPFALDHVLSANFAPLPSLISSSSSPSSSTTTDSEHGHSRARPGFARLGGESDDNWDTGRGIGDADRKEVKVRLSKRAKMRTARATRMGPRRLGRHPDAAPFPTGEFTFSISSATAERLVTMQQEIVNLRNLFGAELAKQTAKTAKIGTGTGKGIGSGLGKAGKKRAQQRARTSISAESGEQQAEFLEMPQKAEFSGGLHSPSPQASQTHSQGQTPTPKKGKKKKRSTMANASNPHHLRNYVPSRLPHAAGGGGSAGGPHGQGQQATSVSTLWPLALKFLSADLPPRRHRDPSGRGQDNSISAQYLPQVVVPQEEWICAFCEYSLFYGEDAEYRRALRNRKKILKRRRRARERAAAAASGVNAAMKNAVATPVTEKTQVGDEDEGYDDFGYDSLQPNSAAARVDGTGRTRGPEPPG